MNYYAKLVYGLNDDYTPDYTQVHISIVEGIYEVDYRQQAKVIGCVNITENSFCKFITQPYDIIHTGEYTITLKKRNFIMDTQLVSYEDTYTLLSYLLIAEGYTQEKITQITTAINNITNNPAIQTSQNVYTSWISFD